MGDRQVKAWEVGETFNNLHSASSQIERYEKSPSLERQMDLPIDRYTCSGWVVNDAKEFMMKFINFCMHKMEKSREKMNLGW